MNYFAVAIPAVCLRALTGLAERALFNADRNLPSDWLSQRVRAALKEKTAANSLSALAANLPLPSNTTVWAITMLFFVLIVVSWLLWLWDPAVYWPDRSTLQSAYSTLWQVDAQISAVALPILLFVIELSKDHKHAAARSHEVLIRETMVFPITLFALLGTVRIGIDVAWFSNPAVFFSDLLLFITTVGLTGHAYYSTLRLLFSPARMKDKALAVIRDKMRDSLNESISLRLANNMLFRKLQELNVGYWPLRGDRRESDIYLVVDAPAAGTLTDINMRKLEGLLRELLLKRRQPTAKSFDATEPASGEGETPAPPLNQDIWIMRQYGERIKKRSDGFLRIKKSAFDEFALEGLPARLQEIVRIEAAHEI